ncbi:MAG: hypothetical protein HDS92_04430 [Bacteroidales bacterium]|nr:hypothetical protein [Bacteroidales bacterium]MBD5377141.1 hypothetical protein [Bacteroides sp.]
MIHYKATRSESGHDTPGPKASTLHFLRQLARCYSPEPALSVPSLSGTILN